MRRYFTVTGVGTCTQPTHTFTIKFITSKHLCRHALYTEDALCYGPRVHRESPLPEPIPISDGQITCHIW